MKDRVLIKAPAVCCRSFLQVRLATDCKLFYQIIGLFKPCSGLVVKLKFISRYWRMTHVFTQCSSAMMRLAPSMPR